MENMSDKIKYSVDLYKDEIIKEENGEILSIKNKNKPKINLQEVKDEKGNTVRIFLLQYEIESIPQEAIVGIMKGRKVTDRAKFIRDLIQEQLTNNKYDKTNDSAYDLLLQNVTDGEDFSFELTQEGQAILSCKNNGIVEIPVTKIFDRQQRTVGTATTNIEEKNEDNIGDNIQNTDTKEAQEKNNNENTSEINTDTKTQEEKNSFIERIKSNVIQSEEEREQQINNILSTLDESEKADFLKGAEIAKLISYAEIKDTTVQENLDKSTTAKKKIVEDYFFNVYSKKMPDNYNLYRVTECYIIEKEKGIILDIEEQLKKIKDAHKNENELQDVMQNYMYFFTAIKNGNNLNAKFSYLIKKLDLESLKKIFERMQVDDEMLEYMDIKRQIMEKPGNIDNNDEKSIEMNEFLAHSKNRKSNTETCINAIITCYPISKEETLKEYSEQISVYNKYALKNGMPICPTHNRLAMSPRQLPEEKMPDDK